VPKVSIITRTKNRPALLERTLCSIRKQTFTDWEWVLVDAGNDSPGTLVREFLESEPVRTRRVEASGDLLMGAMSNIGVRAGNADYVVLLDDDDTWHPEFLQKAVERLDNPLDPLIGGVAAQTNRVYEHKDQDGQWITEKINHFNPTLECLEIASLTANNRFTVNAFLYQRGIFEHLGGYREDLPVLDDWDFNLRFILKSNIDVLPEPLANWHIRRHETSGSQANSLVAAKSKHLYYRAAIINGYLREEIADGKPGLGQLIGSSSLINSAHTKIESLQRKLVSVSQKVGRIDARTKTLKDMTVRGTKNR
jgi:glycosyltransferase involved in cell wall biosynthesis